MEQDLNATVTECRRCISDLACKVERLERAVEELEGQAQGGDSKEAARSLRAAQTDLECARRDLEALTREYARFRLEEAIGADPAHINTELFDQELLAVSRGPLTRREPRAPADGRIGFDAFRSLMLADIGLDQALENEESERRTGVIVDGTGDDGSTKRLLRQWAGSLQSDPYVSGLLGRAADAASRFARCLNDFTRGLDNLRINYEISQRKVDHLVFSFEDKQPVVQASNDWHNMQELLPDECRALLENFLGLSQARDELRKLRDELNTELRAFMAVFVPRSIAYALRQSKARQRGLGLGRSGARRLCDHLLDEVEQADFLVPQGGGIELAVPRIPREFAQFRKLKAFREYKKSLDKAALADAPTVAEDSA